MLLASFKAIKARGPGSAPVSSLVFPSGSTSPNRARGWPFSRSLRPPLCVSRSGRRPAEVSSWTHFGLPGLGPRPRACCPHQSRRLFPPAFAREPAIEYDELSQNSSPALCRHRQITSTDNLLASLLYLLFSPYLLQRPRGGPRVGISITRSSQGGSLASMGERDTPVLRIIVIALAVDPLVGIGAACLEVAEHVHLHIELDHHFGV